MTPAVTNVVRTRRDGRRRRRFTATAAGGRRPRRRLVAKVRRPFARTATAVQTARFGKVGTRVT